MKVEERAKIAAQKQADKEEAAKLAEKIAKQAVKNTRQGFTHKRPASSP